MEFDAMRGFDWIFRSMGGNTVEVTFLWRDRVDLLHSFFSQFYMWMSLHIEISFEYLCLRICEIP